MKRYTIIVLALLSHFLLVPATNVSAQTQLPIVHAVLFYSPNCGHCQHVITEVLPPLIEKYGTRLEIIGVDVTQPQGQTLFLATLQSFGMEQAGVPFLVIDHTYLVGSVDIPEKFPGLIESYLAQGGVDWPAIPGLREAIGSSAGTDEPVPTLTAESAAPQATPLAVTLNATTAPLVTASGVPPDAHNTDWTINFAHDLAGNSAAVIVLLGMVASVAWTVLLLRRKKNLPANKTWQWTVPMLCVAGAGVAGYLAYVEMFQVTAVCGPVGDCNTVQQSEYARLFGMLPIGVLGLIGYAAIFISWLVTRYSRASRANLGSILIFMMAGVGTLFSIYLTFLEPFVIGATCAWCLTSSILMTALMLLSLTPAKRTMEQMGWISRWHH